MRAIVLGVLASLGLTVMSGIALSAGGDLKFGGSDSATWEAK